MDLITFIGVIFTLAVSLTNIFVTLRQSNKNTFINTITIARKEYLTELRKAVAEFCAIAITEKEDNSKLVKLSYQLKLYMNPASYINSWDSKAIEMINKITETKIENRKDDVDKFIALMQSWLALEWHGMTYESKFGVINEKEKQKLRDKFYFDYLRYIKNNLNPELTPSNS